MIEITGILEEDPIVINSKSSGDILGWTLEIATSESWKEALKAKGKEPRERHICFLANGENKNDSSIINNIFKGEYVYISGRLSRSEPTVWASTIQLPRLKAKKATTQEIFIDEGKEKVTIENCRLAMECHKKWEELIIEDNVKFRYCLTCEKGVHWCDTDEDIQEAVLQGQCVAFKQKKDGPILLGRPASTSYDDYEHEREREREHKHDLDALEHLDCPDFLKRAKK